MGKASRRRAEKRQNNMSSSSKKILKDLLKESKPEPFVINDKLVYFNPLKKLLEGEAYKTADGVAVTKDMVEKYEQFLKTRFKQEQLAKINNVDINKLDKEEK